MSYSLHSAELNPTRRPAPLPLSHPAPVSLASAKPTLTGSMTSEPRAVEVLSTKLLSMKSGVLPPESENAPWGYLSARAAASRAWPAGELSVPGPAEALVDAAARRRRGVAADQRGETMREVGIRRSMAGWESDGGGEQMRRDSVEAELAALRSGGLDVRPETRTSRRCAKSSAGSSTAARGPPFWSSLARISVYVGRERDRKRERRWSRRRLAM